MAMTETIQKLYVDGEWYETGETADVSHLSAPDRAGTAG